MTDDVPTQLRGRKPVGYIPPYRQYRDLLSKNYSPELSTALITQLHGTDWLIFAHPNFVRAAQ